jgi:RNA polymerase sigma-70 factor, ECF subfamily
MMAFMPFVAAQPASDATDAVLVQSLAEGDHRALDTLYRAHSSTVYRYALAMSGNAAWAADATQDAFIGLTTRPGSFDAERGSVAAYLIGAARHTLWAQWRLQKHLEPWPADDADTQELPDDAAPDPLHHLVRAQTAAEVWAALRHVPWPQREAVVLVDLQDHSYVQAARIAGIELNTLRTRVHRGRAKLAVLLAAPATTLATAGATAKDFSP